MAHFDRVTWFDEALPREDQKSVDNNPLLRQMIRRKIGMMRLRRLVHGVWCPGGDQVLMLLDWSQYRRWGLTRQKILAMEECMPAWPDIPGVVLVLTPYLEPLINRENGDELLDSVERTVCELRRLVGFARPADERQFSSGSIRLRADVYHTPGLRWELIDCRESASQVDAMGEDLPSAGILAMAAYNPDWLPSIDEMRLHPQLSGYETGAANGTRFGSPWLCSEQRRTMIHKPEEYYRRTLNLQASPLRPVFYKAT